MWKHTQKEQQLYDEDLSSANTTATTTAEHEAKEEDDANTDRLEEQEVFVFARDCVCNNCGGATTITTNRCLRGGDESGWSLKYQNNNNICSRTYHGLW